MKDMYELLNYVEIDDEEIPKANVSEIEKEKVKKNINKCLNRKNYRKYAAAAAVICGIFIGGIGILGVINPTYAADIPIIGDIFIYIDNGKTGAFDKYKENSNEINIAKESHGVTLTIKDAVFDGNVISYTYEVKTNKKLGEDIHFVPDRNKMINGQYSGYFHDNCKKVSDGNYWGRAQIRLHEEASNLDTVNLKLVFKELHGFENGEKISDIKGSWSFNIDNLQAIENKEINVNKSVEKDDILVNINSITKSPISLTINYSQELSDELYNSIYYYENEEELPVEDMENKMKESAQIMLDKNVKLEVRDDIGNEYISSGSSSGGGDGKIMNFQDTFKDIDEKATKLIITPKNSETIFDDIVVDLDK